MSNAPNRSSKNGSATMANSTIVLPACVSTSRRDQRPCAQAIAAPLPLRFVGFLRIGHIDPSTARLCNSVINRNKLHRKGVDLTGGQRQDFGGAHWWGLANKRKNAAPLGGGADIPPPNARGILRGGMVHAYNRP